MPIEEMARRGRDTLAFGPMRPVGLIEPRTGKRPFAVAQARQDDAAATLYNLVGFQTKMTYPAQRRVLRMIPGLAEAEFVRLGSLHRNTFIDSPTVLRPTLQLRSAPNVFLAGQLIGVEGYVESAASGLIAGRTAAAVVRGEEPTVPPRTTAIGALAYYVSHAEPRGYQPTNITFGIMPPPENPSHGRRLKKEERKTATSTRALLALDEWIEQTSAARAEARALHGLP